MLKFITMLAIIALAFCTATVFVALIVGGVLKASQAMKGKTAQKSV